MYSTSRVDLDFLVLTTNLICILLDIHTITIGALYRNTPKNKAPLSS